VAIMAAAAVLGVATLVTGGRIGAGVGVAHAQTTHSELRLGSQTPWVAPGGEFALRLLIDTPQPPTEVEVVVAVYRAVASRTEFTRSLEVRPRTVPITVTPPTALSALMPDPVGGYWVRLPIQDPAQPLDATRLRLDDEGVFPVRVELRRVGGGQTQASLLTHLLYASPPPEGGSELGVGLVLPVHAPPALTATGERRMPPGTSDRLGSLARSLVESPDVALTLLATPETLEALETSPRASDRETLTALAAATEARQVAASTYVPVDLPALAGANLAGEVEAQLDRGNAVIERTLGRRPDARTWIADRPLTDGVVQQLRSQQVDRMVVPEADLVPIALERTLTQPFELDSDAVRRPEVLAGDTGLAAYFATNDDPVLAAHHLLADLAVISADQPSRSRAVVVVAPRSWRPGPGFVDTVLAGLGQSPVLAPATLATLFTDVPPATSPAPRSGDAPLVRKLAPAQPGPPIARAQVRRARSSLSAFSSMLRAENPLDDDVEARLLVSQSAELPAAEQRAYLAGVDRAINDQLALIEVPDEQSVTLTARKGEIPVTVLSRAGYPVTVSVGVASEKLSFPDGASRPMELTRLNTTERFAVQARTSGAFPLRLEVTTPDGGLVVGTSRFTVRSTAASSVGVVLSVGAGLFLVVWWGRHVQRGRKGRQGPWGRKGRRNRRLIPA